MKLLADEHTKQVFLSLTLIGLAFLVLSQGAVWLETGHLSPILALLSLLAFGGSFFVWLRYFRRQEQILEEATAQVNAYLAGDRDARIDCDREGQLYRLFHCVNALAAVLDAHADNELRKKEFLKDTISDISHQLKTPLAALNIYNGLLLEEASVSVKEFARLSEKELDRMEALVQNLLKITRLDAGAIVIRPVSEDVSALMDTTRQHFAYRAKAEHKALILSGPDDLTLFCDRVWLTEALDNLVKNALDHTGAGAVISLNWKALPNALLITVADNGSGIHPEDLPHIFKRFYRSRFSQDTQGIGLGLPLAKAIIEAHSGTVTVDSALGQGTTFSLYFPNPTKL